MNVQREREKKKNVILLYSEDAALITAALIAKTTTSTTQSLKCGREVSRKFIMIRKNVRIPLLSDPFL
jgi:hypothetical protein